MEVRCSGCHAGGNPNPDQGWVYMGNVFGAPIQVEGKTSTGVKDGYRK